MIRFGDSFGTADFVDRLAKESEKDALLAHLAKYPRLVKVQDAMGQTILHHAVHYRAAALALEHFMTKETLSVADRNGRTPVHYAAARAYSIEEYREVVPIYLRKAHATGYDFSMADTSGETPLFGLITNPCYEQEDDRKNMARYIQEHLPGVNVNIVHKKYGHTPLDYAITAGYLDDAETLLDLGADPLFEVHKNPEVVCLDSCQRVQRKIDSTQKEILRIEAQINGSQYSAKEKFKKSKKLYYLNKTILPKLRQLQNRMKAIATKLHPETALP